MYKTAIAGFCMGLLFATCVFCLVKPDPRQTIRHEIVVSCVTDTAITQKIHTIKKEIVIKPKGTDKEIHITLNQKSS